VPDTRRDPRVSPYTFTATADGRRPAGADAHVLAGGAPSGARIDGSTASFSWTPTEAQGPGSYPFTVRVSDGIANTDKAITVT
jgi:hypothetical protein